jgi:hypothetical protein
MDAAPSVRKGNSMKLIGFPASHADYRRSRGAKIDRPSAARFGRWFLRDGIEVRLQSYIRPTLQSLAPRGPDEIR